MMEKEQKWLQSKFMRVMALYWGFIIVMTYAVEWARHHAAALGLVVFGGLAFLIVVIVARLLYYRFREW